MKIKDPAIVLRMLEGGDFAPHLQDEMNAVLKALKDAAGTKGKAKGYLNLRLNFEVEGASCSITPELTTKIPKTTRSPEMLFITEDGELSDQHPKQLTMFPREVSGRDRAAGDE